jgi:hypothetical protein
MYHKAGQCPGDFELKLYRRDGQLLWLCSCCCYTSDAEVTQG